MKSDSDDISGVNDVGYSSGTQRYSFSDDANGRTEARGSATIPSELHSDASELDNSQSLRMLQLRANNPFVPILQLPRSAVALVLVPNVAKDIVIPSGAKYAVTRGNADYYLSVNGNAFVPTVDVLEAAPIFRPDGLAFYVENTLSMSVVSSVAAIVTTHFYFQQ